MSRAWGDDAAPWPPDAEPFAGLRWRWRRWRARHYVLRAEWAMKTNPNRRTMEAWCRAQDFLAHVEAARP